MIIIYDYEWAGDDDGSTWAPFEAAVMEIGAESLKEDCDGSIIKAIEEGWAEHTGEYEVAPPSEVPRGVRVYGDATEVAKEMCASILGDTHTLQEWAEERRIDIAEAERLLGSWRPVSPDQTALRFG